MPRSMNKPLIAVTAGHEYEDKGAGQACLGLRYIQAVEDNGGIPVLTSGRPKLAEALAKRVDGLLLSGGCDVDPACFGQQNRGAGKVDVRRDAFELALCQAMIRLGKPVLGICRGIQVLNVALGGTLIQDIPSWLGMDHPNGTGLRHEVQIEPGCFLTPQLQGRRRVNSTHHQAVDKLGEGLRAVAYAEAGRVIEAIEAEDGRPVWGVQWHPERLREEDPAMNSIFQKLILAAGV